MYLDMLGIVAALTQEFPGLPVRVVVRSVRESVDQLPEADSYLITSAARAKLSALQRSGSGV